MVLSGGIFNNKLMDKVKIIDETIQVTNINKDGKYFEKGNPRSF